jgi:hypothetical protein
MSSLWSRKPSFALRMAVVIVRMKSGATLVRGQRRPRPSAARPSWLIRMAEVGVDLKSRREAKNCEMISSVAEVGGPFHSSQSGLEASVGRL